MHKNQPCTMNKLVSLFLLLLCNCIMVSANSDTQSNESVKFILSQERGFKGNRMPAKPVYGEYDNGIIRVFVAENDEMRFSITIESTETELIWIDLSSSDLVNGLYVGIMESPCTVTLQVNGSVYSGNIN